MPKGRPRNFDFDRTLDSAMRLFWKQGFEATSLQQLLGVMKLSKSSLYQSYGTKEELFVLCLQHYLDKIISDLTEELSRDPSGKQFIQRYFLSIIQEADTRSAVRGCYLVNTVVEFARSHKTISPLVTKGMERYRELFHTALIQAQNEGEINNDYNPQVMSQYLLSSMSGLRTMVKGGMGMKELQEVVSMTLRCFA